MAEDLGDIRVNIEQEGAQEAADTIGDAMGEGEAGGPAGGGGEGTVGGLLGGISTKLAGILGFVSFLASLKPIQELLSGIQRFFSAAILPLVQLLNAFLRPILQKLFRFISTLDFDNLISSLITNLTRVFNNLTDRIGRNIAGSIPGVGQDTGSQAARNAASGAVSNLLGVGAGIGPAFGPLSQAGATYITEQSPTAIKQSTAESSSKETSRNKTGPE